MTCTRVYHLHDDPKFSIIAISNPGRETEVRQFVDSKPELQGQWCVADVDRQTIWLKFTDPNTARAVEQQFA